MSEGLKNAAALALVFSACTKMIAHAQDSVANFYKRSTISLVIGAVMPLSLHPYITGVPHRIDALDRGLEYICRHSDVWFATGSEIVAHYRSLTA